MLRERQCVRVRLSVSLSLRTSRCTRLRMCTSTLVRMNQSTCIDAYTCIQGAVHVAACSHQFMATVRCPVREYGRIFLTLIGSYITACNAQSVRYWKNLEPEIDLILDSCARSTRKHLSMHWGTISRAGPLRSMKVHWGPLRSIKVH